MALPAAILLLLTGGVAMIVAAAMSRPAANRTLIRRIDMVAAAPVETGKISRAVSLTKSTEAFLERLFAFGQDRSWGTHSSGTALLLLALVSAALTWGVLSKLLGLPSWIAAIASIAAFLVLPHFKLAGEQRGAEALFIDRFPDAIDSIIRMLRAGLPISAAIRAVAGEPSPPVDAVFRTVADQMDVGVTLEAALAIAGRRIDLADFRFFAVAVALQHSTGGNLTTTLDILSEIIRKRRAMRLKASAVTAEVRMTAYVLAAIPVVVVLGLLVVNPGYLSPLIHDPRGNWIIVAAFGSLGTGFFTMQRMMRSAIHT